MGIIVATAVAGCAAGEASPVDRAQAQVNAKESALADAQAEFESASAQFCDASSAYVESLDRYGDVLNATAPTVGDVRTAGADLVEPREEAVSAAEAAADAKEDVATAEQELADARRALEQAVAEASGAPAPAQSPSPESTSLIPPATIDRVEQAEADFADVQESISADTPLAEASEQFHSAAVSLEFAWIRLLIDAGCVTDEQALAADEAVTALVAALQQDLTTAGYYADAIDGIYGPATTAAVEALQEANGLPVTGTVDQATADALEAEVAAIDSAKAQGELTSTAAVLQTLKLLGYWDGAVDGVWTPELTTALQSLQTDLGVEPTGTVDAATIAALDEALSKLQLPDASPSPSPTG